MGERKNIAGSSTRRSPRPAPALTYAQQRHLLAEVKELSSRVRHDRPRLLKKPAAVVRAEKVVSAWHDKRDEASDAFYTRMAALRKKTETAVIFADSKQAALDAVAQYAKAVKGVRA